MNNEKIVINLNKKNILLLFLGSVILLSIDFLILKFKIYNSTLFSDSAIMIFFIILILLFGLIFFSFSTIYSFIKLFDSKPGLIIDSDKIIDNSFYASVGEIDSSDIISIDIEKSGSVKMITISVSDPDKYINRFSGLKKFILTIINRSSNTPISIYGATLETNIDQIYEILYERFIANKKVVKEFS